MIVDSDFQTPIPVANYMAGLIPEWCKRIGEPTPGLGNLVNAVREKNPAAEIIFPEGDFFLMKPFENIDCIIMNPPFNSKSAYMVNAPKDSEKWGIKLGYHILTECMEMSNNIIALMPWYTIADSDVRLRFIKAYGIKSITALPRKTFQYARVQTVVLELQKDWKEETIFRTFDFKIERKKRKRKTDII